MDLRYEQRKEAEEKAKAKAEADAKKAREDKAAAEEKAKQATTGATEVVEPGATGVAEQSTEVIADVDPLEEGLTQAATDEAIASLDALNQPDTAQAPDSTTGSSRITAEDLEDDDKQRKAGRIARTHTKTVVFPGAFFEESQRDKGATNVIESNRIWYVLYYYTFCTSLVRFVSLHTARP